MSRLVIIAFLAVCLINLYPSINANAIPPPVIDDKNPVMMGQGRGISWECTAKCTEFWACKAKCLMLCNCDYPGGCDCNNWGR